MGRNGLGEREKLGRGPTGADQALAEDQDGPTTGAAEADRGGPTEDDLTIGFLCRCRRTRAAAFPSTAIVYRQTIERLLLRGRSRRVSPIIHMPEIRDCRLCRRLHDR